MEPTVIDEAAGAIALGEVLRTLSDLEEALVVGDGTELCAPIRSQGVLGGGLDCGENAVGACVVANGPADGDGLLRMIRQQAEGVDERGALPRRRDGG